MEGKEHTTPLFPLVRYKHFPELFDNYYAIGNTPADDLLESCTGIAEPTVLSLGCGDIRSCFYTLWKHFDSSISNAPQQFDRVQFLLNDYSSAVLARNILFILLCLRLPDSLGERKKWLSAMWAVWYCLELYPLHQKILDDSLKLLLKYSEDWSCASNPLRDLVHFTSPVVLAEISQVWKMWLNGHFSVKEMHSSRQKLFKFRTKEENFEDIVSEVAHRIVSCLCISILGDYSEAKEEAVIPGVISFFKCGSCYAESVLKMDSVATPTTANPTLYDNQDGRYSLFFSLNPFNCYHHAVEFSPGALKKAGVEKHLFDAMLVDNGGFKQHSLLANCVQQFFMWLQSSSAALNKKVVSFVFNNQDALQFCQEQQYSKGNQFDVIHTSNLIDHLGLPNVILCALPLLKSEGLLFSQTMLYKVCSSECIEEFLEMSFGFDCKLLPVIIGARCVNHEGMIYTSPVMSQPTPERKENMACSLVWQKVFAQPIVIPKLPALESGSITEGLVQSFETSTLPLITQFEEADDKHIVCPITIETAILVLRSFMSSVVISASSISDYHFWEPLSKGIAEPLKPFLCGLQTQALLHNLHIHFMIDEKSCPICKHSPIEEYVGLFCAELPKPEHGPFNFTAYIHPSDVPFAQLKSGNIHIIDCFDGSVHGKTMKLKFFAPRHFVSKNFCVTITTSAICIGKNYMLPVSKHTTTTLQSMQVEFEHYNFFGVQHSSSFPSHLVSNLYTQDGVVSEIAFTEEGLTSSNLKTDLISSSEIQLSCGGCVFNLRYVFPVNYGKTKIQISSAQKWIKVICPRLRHSFLEERPNFIVCPDHQLSLPPHPLKNEALDYHADIQLTYEGLVRIVNLVKSSVAPSKPAAVKPDNTLFEVKKILQTLFKCKDMKIFHLTPSDRKMCGMIFVNKHMLDYQHHVPALDLAFCFLEDHSYPESVMSLKKEKNHTKLSPNFKAYKLLKRVLNYFAKRTNGDCKSAGVNSVYHTIAQQGMEKYFIRAVIYFLYGNPDDK